MDYEMYGSSAGSVMAVVVIAAMIALIFSIGAWILDVIGRWKINTKAGYKGWYAIIPCLSEYTMFELSTGTGWLGILYFITQIFGVGNSYNTISQAQQGSMSGGGGAISTLLSIVSFVLSIYLAVKMARAFGKGIGFTIFLFLLAPIARLVLGFGSSRYLGVDGEGLNGYGHTGDQDIYQTSTQSDVPGSDPGSTSQSNAGAFSDVPPAPAAPQIHFCKKCGKEAAPGARFCEECGAPLD